VIVELLFQHVHFGQHHGTRNTVTDFLNEFLPDGLRSGVCQKKARCLNDKLPQAFHGFRVRDFGAV
jgi:hypothetical protein